MPSEEATLASLIDSARAAQQSGAWDEALEHYEAAFSRLPAEGDAGDAAKLLRWIGHVRRERGDIELAGEVYEASLAIAEASERRADIAGAVNCLALLDQIRGRLEQAERLYNRAGELAEAVGDDRLAAMVNQNLGMLATIRGQVEPALGRYRSALERFQRLEDDLAAAWVLNNMGILYIDQTRWDAAESSFDQAFVLADRVRDTATLGSVETNRAELHLKRRDFERARNSCDRAYEIFNRLGARRWLAEAHKLYGMLYRETGKPGLAEHHFSQAVEGARASEYRLVEAESLSEWAVLHGAEDRNREALECLNRAHAMFTELGARREVLDLDRRLDGLEETYLQIVRRWGESIEETDEYTAGHCQRVADYTCMLAESAGFEGRDLTWVRMGSFLHDVGKTAVPVEILNKPGKLDSDEWEIMQSHTVEGDDIVAGLGFPWDIRSMVRSHHEHWDGGGYPDGLEGDAIPKAARILCIADMYDALTTARPYRAAMSHGEAFGIMERDAGRILDPDLFKTFRGLVEENGGAAAHRQSTTAAA